MIYWGYIGVMEKKLETTVIGRDLLLPLPVCEDEHGAPIAVAA